MAATTESPVPTTTKRLTHAEATAVLHAAGTDWDDLVYKMTDALAEFYDDTNGTGPDPRTFETYSARAMRWAEGKVNRWAVEVAPEKDV